MRVNVERSIEVGRRIQAEPKECWKNSILAIMSIDELENATYCEGVVTFLGIVIEHGWLELNDEIIDPTWYLIRDEEDDQVRYFQGERYTKTDIEVAIDRFNGVGENLLAPISSWQVEKNRIRMVFDSKVQDAIKEAWKSLGVEI